MKTTSPYASTLAIVVMLCAACASDDTDPDQGGAGTGGIIAGGTGGPATSGSGGKPAGSDASGGTGGSGVSMTTGGTGGNAGGSGGAAGSSGSGGMGSGGDDAGMMTDGAVSNSPFPQLPVVDSTDGPGPFSEVVKVKDVEPGGWLIYPKEIGKDGIKHPLFVFGPGGGTTPQTYEDMGMHWDRYGSYGFVIYVLPASTGDGADMKAGLDWLIEQNDVATSPLYQHLDTSKVCAAGHSQGSITVFNFMPDDRVTTTINISGGSMGGSQGPEVLTKDSMFLCGPDASADVAFTPCEQDFAKATAPTFYTNIQGSSHLTSGRLGWEAIIAWMLWHLAGQEDQWKKEFLEPTGKFRMGIYKSQIKNW
jgi:hypothetical protein